MISLGSFIGGWADYHCVVMIQLTLGPGTRPTKHLNLIYSIWRNYGLDSIKGKNDFRCYLCNQLSYVLSI